MSERPIIFSAPMVRAILEDRKTQTRRTIRRGQVFRILPGSDLDADERRAINAEPFHWERGSKAHPTLAQLLECCPYGVAGDRLWVRETWCFEADPITSRTTDRVLYRATDRCDFLDDGDGYAALNKDGSERSPWRPSIHMPRAASRLTLEVVAVRVERLSAISEEDAKAEGVASITPCPACKGDEEGCCVCDHTGRVRVGDGSLFTKRDDFLSFFRQLNKLSPDADPWVWVVEFRRAKAKE